MTQRPNWIEINLDALAANIKSFRKLAGDNVKILLPVKADAYGHGSLACSFAAQQFGVDYLGVAHVFEGMLLRQYGITLPILVLGPALEDDFSSYLKFDLLPTLSGAETIEQWGNYVRNRPEQVTPPVHIKIDSGMHRYGLDVTDHENIARLLGTEGLKVEGLFSHFATADDPDSRAARRQLQQFSNLVNFLEKKNLRPPLVHMANSAAAINFTESHFDMIRPGIGLYGYNPMGLSEDTMKLRPMLTMKTTIRQIHQISAGGKVSYGQIWEASKDTTLASVAIGYGDGYPRGQEDSGLMGSGENLYPIAGRICMDTTMLDLGELDSMKQPLKAGDVITVIDGTLSPKLSLEALAERHNTISYEIACRIARRLYRFYWWNGQKMRWDDLRPLLGVGEFTDENISSRQS